MTGSMTLSSRLPAAPPKATAASLPMTWATTWETASGIDRVDLARHDRRARLQVGDADLGQPGPGTAAHPAQVGGALVERHRDGAQHARRLHQGVAGPLGLEVVPGLGERQLSLLGQALDHSAGEASGAR